MGLTDADRWRMAAFYARVAVQAIRRLAGLVPLPDDTQQALKSALDHLMVTLADAQVVTDWHDRGHIN